MVDARISDSRLLSYPKGPLHGVRPLFVGTRGRIGVSDAAWPMIPDAGGVRLVLRLLASRRKFQGCCAASSGRAWSARFADDAVGRSVPIAEAECV